MEQTTELQAWLRSSADPTQVSAKVSGIILALSSIITALALQFFHVQLSPADIGGFATGIGMVAGAIWFVWGLIRHVVVKVGTVRK